MATLTTFRGHVQGVGFRYQTYRIARRFAVQGWVRNCPDGSVELFLQGPPDDVAAVLQEVRESMRYHIRSVESRQLPDDPACTSFEIRL